MSNCQSTFACNETGNIWFMWERREVRFDQWTNVSCDRHQAGRRTTWRNERSMVSLFFNESWRDNIAMMMMNSGMELEREKRSSGQFVLLRRQVGIVVWQISFASLTSLFAFFLWSFFSFRENERARERREKGRREREEVVVIHSFIHFSSSARASSYLPIIIIIAIVVAREEKEKRNQSVQ